MTLNKKLFLVIWFGATLSVLAVLPYAFDLQREVLQTVPRPMPILVLLSLAQSAILLAVATYLGLFFAKRVGFKLTVLEPLLSGNGKSISWKKVLILPVVLSIITALAVAFGDWLFSVAGVTIEISDASSIPIWKRFLASFYGGIGEEILMRLWLVSMFVWVLAKITKNNSPLSHTGIVWIAIAMAAVLFGIGHLPATAAVADITPLVVARAITLNGIFGLLFGWLYWRRGLESAMIAHFTADIMILIVLPAILG